MNGWVFLCKEGFSEDRGIRPQTLVYEAHLQGNAPVPNASPHPLIRCRARCKSRRGHCAEALICRLDF